MKSVILYHSIVLKVIVYNIEIEKIQSLYKRYDDIINEIYLGEDGKLQINQTQTNLNYVNLINLAFIFCKRFK